MKAKLNGLDVLRAFACISVLTFHFEYNELGAMGVSVFFVLSGFLMTYNYYGKDNFGYRGVKDSILFSMKKIAAFYPLQILILCIDLAIVYLSSWGGMSSAQRAETLRSFGFYSVLMQSWIPTKRIAHGALWFLSDMLFVYMLFPALLKLIRAYRSRKKAFSAIAVTVGLMAAFTLVIIPVYNGIWDGMAVKDEADYYYCYIFPPYRLGDFFLGCNLAYLFLTKDKKTVSTAKATALEVLAIAVSALAYYIYCGKYLPKEWRMTMLFLLPSMLLVYSFALEEGFISQRLNCKVVSFIAKVSSEIYIIHQSVKNFVAHLLTTKLPPQLATRWMIFVVSCAAILLICYIWQRCRNLTVKTTIIVLLFILFIPPIPNKWMCAAAVVAATLLLSWLWQYVANLKVKCT